MAWRKRSHFPIIVLMLLFAGCVKEPGIGGRGEIHGRVMEIHHEEGPYYPKPEHRVYIVYGDGLIHDDDVRTGHDGRFRFAWLREGDYRIFTYSECEGDSCLVPVIRDAKVKDRMHQVDIGDLQIVNW